MNAIMKAANELGLTDVQIALAGYYETWLGYVTYSLACAIYTANLSPVDFIAQRVYWHSVAVADTAEALSILDKIGGREAAIAIAEQPHKQYLKAITALTIAIHDYSVLYCRYSIPLAVVAATLELAEQRVYGEVCTKH